MRFFFKAALISSCRHALPCVTEVVNCGTVQHEGGKEYNYTKKSVQFVPKRTHSFIFKHRWRSQPQTVGPITVRARVLTINYEGVEGGHLLVSPHSDYFKLVVMSLQPRWNTEPAAVNELSQFSHVLRRDTCAALAKQCLCGAAQQWNMAVYGHVVWLELHTAMLVSTAFADFLSSPRMVLPRAAWFIECLRWNSYTVVGPMAQITHGCYYWKPVLSSTIKKKMQLRWMAPFIW